MFTTPPQDAAAVTVAAAAYGVPAGGRAMCRAEHAAATRAVESGVYIVWRGRNGADCARVGGKSRCFCGCPLEAHAPINAGNPQPPPCRACACPRFEYVPSRPEEVGMWWLPRRKGFDVRAWRAPCRCKHGHDAHDPVTRRCTLCGCSCFKSAYACLGCDRGQEEHETCFELASERTAANRPVGDEFFPLHGAPPALRQAVLGPRAAAAAPPPAVEASPEELYERGAIGADEYHRRVATTGELAAGFPPGGLSAAFPPVAGGGGGGGGSGGTAAVARRGGAAAHAPPTVRMGRVQLADGTVANFATNLGPPIPQPGRDWNRPWEPAPAAPPREVVSRRFNSLR